MEVAGAFWPGERPPRMDVRIKGLRTSGPTYDDVDVQVTHLDCASHVRMTTADALSARVRDKESKYMADSKALGHHFVPFVVSTDGVPSDPAKKFMKTLAEALAAKWRGAQGDRASDQGTIRTYVQARVQAAIVKGVSACVRGDRARMRRTAADEEGDDDFQERAALGEIVGAGLGRSGHGGHRRG